MIFYRNLQEITFRLTNVILERIIFVSRGITVYYILFCLKYYPPQLLFIDKTNPFKIKIFLLLKTKEICFNN